MLSAISPTNLVNPFCKCIHSSDVRGVRLTSSIKHHLKLTQLKCVAALLFGNHKRAAKSAGAEATANTMNEPVRPTAMRSIHS